MDGDKLRQAARVAAALGFVALVRRDVVTVHTFPLDRPAPRFTGRHAAHALLAHLDGLDGRAATPASAGPCATCWPARARPGSPSCVSDLLTPEWADGLTRLPARGGDVTVVHVLDRAELRPDLSGDLDLVDAETGEVVPVSLAPEQLQAYEASAAAWVDEVDRPGPPRRRRLRPGPGRRRPRSPLAPRAPRPRVDRRA